MLAVSISVRWQPLRSLSWDGSPFKWQEIINLITDDLKIEGGVVGRIPPAGNAPLTDLWECYQNNGRVPFGAEPFTLDSATVSLHVHGGECARTGLP
jgi:hypothetical protein